MAKQMFWTSSKIDLFSKNSLYSVIAVIYYYKQINLFIYKA